MKKVFLFSLLIFGIGQHVKAGDETINVSSQVKSVTVFRSGAEMLHNASAQLKQGNNELVIDNISNSVDINSIQVNVASAVSIMGVEFSNNYLKEAVKSPRIKMLEDSIENLQAMIDKYSLAINNNTDVLNVLKSNRDIKGVQTGLSVAELMKLVDYYKAKSFELQTDIEQLTTKQKKAYEIISKLRNQVQEESRKNISTSAHLVLQLSAAVAGNYNFVISYIARNAYWTPFYDVRVENINSPLKVIYKARITQTTGIDWKKVKLSLSTSMPTQWGEAPLFQPWFLSYINPVAVMNRALTGKVAGIATNSMTYNDEATVIGYGSARRKDISIRGSSSVNGGAEPLYVVNGNPMEKNEYEKINPSSIKSIDVLKDESATAVYGSRGSNGVIVVTLKDGLEDYVSVADNSLNVSFDIDMPYDIPTNGKEQTATLKTMEVPATYKHYGIPKLDKDAYIIADIPDWENLNLLPGSANIIFEGTYVGKSFIDPNSTLDTLSLTLGKDRRVIIKRDKLVDYSSVKFLGSNKSQRFTYEITVKNNKKEAVNLLLKDQFPLSTTKEVTVELVDDGKAEVRKETGILNWKLKLAPNESKKVRFTYTVTYPKDKTLNLN